MKCPHCSVTVHLSFTQRDLTTALDDEEKEIVWEARCGICPSCGKAVIYLQYATAGYDTRGQRIGIGDRTPFLAWPQSSNRPCLKEVPREVASDFDEAVRVLAISPQASAALTRRSLQQILRDYGQTKKKDLFDQIEEVVTGGQVPHALGEQLSAVRVIGNFAAHPLKSQATGMILPVEAHEAEWNLDVLEATFDHYFVKPAQANARKAALNEKLTAAGKVPLP